MPVDPQHSSLRILRQLYLLRNILIVFILMMIALAVFGLDIRLPILPLTVVLLIMAVTNLMTRWLIRSGRAISDRQLFAQLLVEIIAFTLILYFTGGATNPFTFLYLIPLAIAATVIPGKPTWLLTGLTFVLYSLLLKFYQPLGYDMQPHQGGMRDSAFSTHVIGMWFGFLLAATLVTLFVTWLSRELKRRDHAIEQAKRREIRDQQLVALGTLAAGAAHELGTPLGSMALIVGDLTEGIDPQAHPRLFEDQKLLRDQIRRCKQILSVLSDQAGETRADAGGLMPAGEMIRGIVDRWRRQRPRAEARLELDIPSQARLLYDKPLEQALVNLLNNAADAGEERVLIQARGEKGWLLLDITDSGPGLSEEQIAMAGEKLFSSKPDGMGIGLFLAITTLRRSGGDIRFESTPGQGALTRVRLPLMNSESTPGGPDDRQDA
jgi:two-component system sensor histidine kinase RegB